MNHHYRFLACLVVLILAFNDLVIAQEDPRLWDGDGVAVRQGTHLQWQSATAVNEQRQTCVVWADTRSGLRSVYAQMIDADGSPLWETGGLQIAGADWNLFNPAITAVSDGWIIAWLADGLWVGEGTYSAQRLYAQKIDWNGVSQWPAGGVELLYDPDYYICEDDYRLFVVHDGNGGALLAWLDGWNNYDIFAARILANGSLDWGGVLAVTAIQGSQIPNAVVSDGSGNMIIAWTDDRNANDLNIYAAKVTAEGTLPWGEGVNGIPICMADGCQRAVTICAELSSGGIYCTWLDERVQSNWKRYIQRIDGSGSIVWQADGVLFCDAHYSDSYTRMASSMNGEIQDGAVLVWNDVRVNGFVNEVYAQKVNPDGTALWGENGVRVCGDAGPAGLGNTRDASRIISDLAGGAIINWNDTRHSNNNICQYDLYAARLNSSGTNLWSECGELIAGGRVGQYSGTITISETASAVDIIYTDESATGSGDLKHQRVALNDGSLLLEPANNLLSGIEGDIGDPHVISMSGDRAAIVWEDHRGHCLGKAIYYQIVDSDGAAELPLHGSMIAPDNTGGMEYYQSQPALASDGNGGFFVTFMDLRTGVKVNRLTRISSTGQIASDLAGVIVHEAELDQISALTCPDGDGGCYVAWSEYDFSFVTDVYVQRFNENCEQQWMSPVRLTDNGPNDDIVKNMIVSSAGCCFVFWESGSSSQSDIIGARICGDGTVAWQGSVCAASRRQVNPYAVADHNGGACIAWEDSRIEGNLEDIYMQHLDASGNALWENDGIAVVSQTRQQSFPKLAVANSNDIYVIWEDFRSGSNLDLYAQRVDASGNPLWDETGLLICGDGGDQQAASIAVNLSGGIFAVWKDGRDYADDIYGTNLLPDGQPADEWWVAGSGGVICEIAEHQTMPALTPLAPDQTLLAWVDWRSTEREPVMDLYMQSVNIGTISKAETRSEIVPGTFVLQQNYPNPFNPATTIAFTIPQTGHTSLIVYDLLGRTVETLLDKQLLAGNYHIMWNAEALPSGVYFYRLTSGDFMDVKKTILLK